MTNLRSLFSFLFFLILACSTDELKTLGQHYQTHQDYESLAALVAQLPPGADTARVKQLLGEPIDMGFDYRYLIDSLGPNGCVIGAVFHIDDSGKIDDQWIGEICE